MWHRDKQTDNVKKRSRSHEEYSKNINTYITGIPGKREQTAQMRKISKDRKDFFKLVRQLQIQEAQSIPHRLHKQYAPKHAE